MECEIIKIQGPYLSAVQDLKSSCFLAAWGACIDFNKKGKVK